eukprot:PhF_6_TR813/c0_g1_i1/m.1237
MSLEKFPHDIQWSPLSIHVRPFPSNSTGIRALGNGVAVLDPIDAEEVSMDLLIHPGKRNFIAMVPQGNGVGFDDSYLHHATQGGRWFYGVNFFVVEPPVSNTIPMPDAGSNSCLLDSPLQYVTGQITILWKAKKQQCVLHFKTLGIVQEWMGFPSDYCLAFGLFSGNSVTVTRMRIPWLDRREYFLALCRVVAQRKLLQSTEEGNATTTGCNDVMRYGDSVLHSIVVLPKEIVKVVFTYL